jgi:predicted transcriptional regulator
LSTAVSHLLSGFQEDLPVVENGQVVGVLTRSALVRGLHTIGPGAMVSDVMDRSFITASPDDPLDVAYSKLAACRCRTIPVTQGRSLLGLLTSDNVAEYVVFRRAVG